MNKRLIYVLGVSVAIVLVFGMLFLPAIPKKTDETIQSARESSTPAQTKIPAAESVINRPRLDPLVKRGIVSLEEASKQLTKINIKLPPADVLPKGFTLKGVLVRHGGTYEYKGATYTTEYAYLIYFDRDLPSDMDVLQFFDAGGIYVEYVYGPGENSTAPFESSIAINKEQNISRALYLWGYPAKISPGYIDAYNFKEHVSYRVESGRGIYSEQELLRILESVLRG